MKIQSIIRNLKAKANPTALVGMARFGINPESALGVSMPVLRKMAKELGKNRVVAKELWLSGIHEARILASMVEVPDEVTEGQMEDWVKDFDSWDVCDQVCMNLFEDTKLAYKKCRDWVKREKEYEKRAGFVMIARMAVSDKLAKDRIFEEFFPLIMEGAVDDRNFVKKAVNWALRQIGKRNISLNKKAIIVCKKLMKYESKTARWIAADALRELQSDSVLSRLNRQS